MMDGIPRGLRLMAAGALVFSVMSALGKLAGQTLPLFEIVFGRAIVMALLSALSIRKQGLSFRPHEPGLLFTRALTGVVSVACYFYSIIHLPLADATVVYFTNPVLTAIVAAFLLHERMGAREIALIMVSLCGVVVVARPSFLFGGGSGLDPLAVTLGLISAAFGALSYVTIRRIKHDPPVLVVFVFSSVTCLLAAPLLMLGSQRPNLAEAGMLVGMGIATYLGQMFITLGLRLERAGRASAVGYLQIVFAAGWGWLLFGERPEIWTWLGAAVVVGATLRLVRIPPQR